MLPVRHYAALLEWRNRVTDTFIIVSPEERSRYTAIIDAILATADLETISRKKIRQGLETSLGGKDLSEQKVTAGDAYTRGQYCRSCNC